MKIHFHKYQGTGNDFILLDNREWSYTSLPTGRVKQLCDRRLGIGADGLMLLNPRTGFDFEMKYYNADGRESSMCGNGARCMVKFAWELGIRQDSYQFLTADGEHRAVIEKDETVRLKMNDVTGIREYDGDYIVQTGSPHYVKIVGEVMDYDVYHRGMEIRYHSDFAKEGINVNFVELRRKHEILVRTYERGVEDETLSCGTGVTASALVYDQLAEGHHDVEVITRGGRLLVAFDKIAEDRFENIWLCGPAEKIFEGDIEPAP
jgi:diaminopimelate epimerase